MVKRKRKKSCSLLTRTRIKKLSRTSQGRSRLRKCGITPIKKKINLIK